MAECAGDNDRRHEHRKHRDVARCAAKPRAGKQQAVRRDQRREVERSDGRQKQRVNRCPRRAE
jgi:hypothetical protein